MKIDREKAITMAAAVAGVGALIFLQKLTTPHRRPQPPLNSSQSASTRLLHPHQHPTRYASAPGLHGADGPAAPLEAALSRDRRSASRPRPPPGAVGSKGPRSGSRSIPLPNAAKQDNPGGHLCRSSRATSSAAQATSHNHPLRGRTDQLATATLTIENLSEHRRREGTMYAVQEQLSSPDPNAHREFPVTGSPEEHSDRSGIDATLDERLAKMRECRQAYRSPSNVATVGSKSVEGCAAAAVSPTAGAATSGENVPRAAALDAAATKRSRDLDMSHEDRGRADECPVPSRAPRGRRARPQAGDCSASAGNSNTAAASTASPPEGSPHRRRSSSHRRVVVGVQTEAVWFTENHGTQTDLAMLPAPAEEDSLTPPKAHTTGAPGVDAEPSDRSELALSPIYHTDAIDQLDSTAPTPIPAASAAAVAEDDKADCPFIPHYLILDMERQLRAIIRSLSAATPHNVATWMVLYCYLKELPPSALRTLRTRGRLPPVPQRGESLMVVDGDPYIPLVEGQDALEKETASLLLGDAAALEVTGHYFKWKSNRIVRCDGDYAAALAKKLEALRTKAFDAGRVGHRTVKDDSRDVDGANAVDGGAEDEEEEGPAERTDADRVAAVVRRYAFVLVQAASTQTDSDAVRISLGEPVSTTENVADYKTPIHASGVHGYTALSSSSLLEAANVREEQVQLLLQRLVGMKDSNDFDRIRHGQGSALFACDFIEVAAEAQRLLNVSSHTQPPTTFKGVQAVPWSEEVTGNRTPALRQRTTSHIDEASARSSFLSQDSGAGGGGSGGQPSKPGLHIAFRRGRSSRSAIGLLSPDKLTAAVEAGRVHVAENSRYSQANGATAA